MGKAVANAVPAWIDATTGEIDPERMKMLSYEEIMSEVMDSGQVVHISELDDVVQVEKEVLIGKPFIITAYRFRTSQEYSGTEYVIVDIAYPGGHGVFADGSTGIMEQLRRYDTTKPIYIPKGLRYSDYTYTDPEGKQSRARTYYLDNAS